MERILRIAVIVALLLSLGSWIGIPDTVAQTMVWNDTMDSEATGLMSSGSPDPTQYSYRYENGQYVIEAFQPIGSVDLTVYPSVPNLTDASIAVDFSIAGNLTGKYAFAGCRNDRNGSKYSIDVHPGSGRVVMWRFDGDDIRIIGDITDPSAVHIGSANNRIEIVCQGSTIQAIVNGQLLLNIQDASFTTGAAFMGAGKDSQIVDTLLVGFDNLAITDLGNTVPPAQPTESSGFPTAIPQQPVQPEDGNNDTWELSDPRVDPDGTLVDLMFYSLLTQPVAGPWSAHDELGPSEFKFLTGDVYLTDVYATVTWTTPPSIPSGIHAIGFTFWSDAIQENYYDLFFQIEGSIIDWKFGQQVNGNYQILQSGTAASTALDLTPGAENFIGLIVSQGMALLIGDDVEVAAAIDLGGAVGSGDVVVEVGFLADDSNTMQGLPVSTKGFRIWDASQAVVSAVLNSDEPAEPVAPTAIPILPTEAPMIPTVVQPVITPTISNTSQTGASTGVSPIMSRIFNQQRAAALANPPVGLVASGILTETTDGFRIMWADVLLSDFYATVTFTNPLDVSIGTDVGLGFRDIGDDGEFRFVVRSNGDWVLSIGPGSPTILESQSAFDAAPGATNTIEVIAHGATGMLAVNGVVIQQVDLSANLNMGDIWIGAGLYSDDSIEGRQTSFSNFAVYTLPA